MTNSYKFGGGSQKPVIGGVKPEGDYSFTVLECDEPYQKDNGHWVLRVKLAILPDNDWVWAAPWSGETSTGEERDGIGDFILSVNRAPATGKEPDWQRIIGAKGRCRLKVGTDLKGSERNEVAFFHAPKQVGPAVSQSPQNVSKKDYQKVQKITGPAELDQEPDDIPF